MSKRGNTGDPKKSNGSARKSQYVPYEEQGEGAAHDDSQPEQIDSILSFFGDGELDMEFAATARRTLRPPRPMAMMTLPETRPEKRPQKRMPRKQTLR